MSARFLLDTNTISEPARPHPDPHLLRCLQEHESTAAIAAPVWHELIFGAELLPASKKRTRIEEYLWEVVHPSFPILPYTREDAARHARERARLRRSGLNPPFIDGQIAAIAQTHGLVVVTSNIKDFKDFEGIELEDWRTSISPG